MNFSQQREILSPGIVDISADSDMTAITDNAVNFIPRRDQILDSLRITQVLQATNITAPGFTPNNNPAGAPLNLNAAGDITLTSTNNDVTAITLNSINGGVTVTASGGTNLGTVVISANGNNVTPSPTPAISLTASASTASNAISITASNAAGGVAVSAGNAGAGTGGIALTAGSAGITHGPKANGSATGGLTVTTNGPAGAITVNTSTTGSIGANATQTIAVTNSYVTAASVITTHLSGFTGVMFAVNSGAPQTWTSGQTASGYNLNITNFDPAHSVTAQTLTISYTIL